MEREKLDEIRFVTCSENGVDCFLCYKNIIDCDCEEILGYGAYASLIDNEE